MNSASPLRIVFDTNVALALELFGDPRLAALHRRWDAGEIIALADETTLAELDRVLRYPELKLEASVAAAIANRYGERCAIVAGLTDTGALLPRCRDPDDQKFLHLALRGDAHWLLTRDKALLRLGKAVRFRIATPEQMLDGDSPGRDFM